MRWGKEKGFLKVLRRGGPFTQVGSRKEKKVLGRHPGGKKRNEFARKKSKGGQKKIDKKEGRRVSRPKKKMERIPLGRAGKQADLKMETESRTRPEVGEVKPGNSNVRGGQAGGEGVISEIEQKKKKKKHSQCEKRGPGGK